MFKHIKKYFNKIVLPVSKNEDIARSEFILNILLVSVLALSIFSFVINLIDQLRGFEPVVPAGYILIVILFFCSLYFLSRNGFVYLAAKILIGVFFLLVTNMQYLYGVDLPMEILSYALIITMAGVLINARTAFTFAFLICFSIVGMGYLQNSGVIEPNRYWIHRLWQVQDFIFSSVLFLIIATVSWLSNREIEKSLIRARKSEAELKVERDNLEITVEERTREIKEMQLEKMGQLYRFAEFGKLSSGLFHDLANPLTAVSLNMELVKNTAGDNLQSEAYLNRALTATKKMEGFIASVRKQISRQENKGVFSLNTEIQQIVEILSFKAAQAKVAIHFDPTTEITTYGDNIQFSQVALNLIGNAIDSYYEYEGSKTREVLVSLTKHEDMILFVVKDYGAGISNENKEKIFEPFFTTKDAKRGTGIGLSLVRGIIEKDFGGTITVESGLGSGSEFIVRIPIRVAQ